MTATYGHVSDARIAAIPHEISEGATAIFLGVTVERVRKVRAEVLARKRPEQPAASTGPAIEGRDEAYVVAPATDGSMRLLKAMLRTGQHFITDPELLARRKRECGLK